MMTFAFAVSNFGHVYRGVPEKRNLQSDTKHQHIAAWKGVPITHKYYITSLHSDVVLRDTKADRRNCRCRSRRITHRVVVVEDVMTGTFRDDKERSDHEQEEMIE
jgi:hypothetical protein